MRRSLPPSSSRRRSSRATPMMLAVVLLLAGCAVAVPDPAPPAPAAAAWQAPLPHDGSPAALAQWWQRFEDPALAGLIESAQQDNPGVAVSLARIDQARATARIAGATRLPTLDANGQLTRSSSPQPPAVAATIAGVSLDALWELDLFGANRRTREAALARLEARTAEWHDARVSLAAEVAGTYSNLRLCEALLQVYQQDLQSQRLVLDLTRRKVRSGFSPPADAALITAATAESSNRARAQRGQCDLLVKSLVTLTAQPEPALRERLAAGSARLPQPALLSVTQVPAAALAQRPDLAALERELVAASHEVGVAEADRYPRIRLSGSIGYAAFRAVGLTGTGATWSFGPSLSLPLFDGGRRAAVVEQSDARFDELVASYRQRAAVAVQEVEEALVRLDSASARLEDADRAAESFQLYLKAARTRFETGAGTAFEQEDARRSSLNAAAALLQVRSERIAALISLYKALGGGWEAAAEAPVAGPGAVSPVRARVPPATSAGRENRNRKRKP
jgi:multidrug efflux system outer membrane protein